MTPRHSPLSLTRLQRWEVNQVRSESVDDGAESKTISPGLCHVDDLYSRISLGHSLTPDLQTCCSCHQHCLLKQVRFNWETETKMLRDQNNVLWSNCHDHSFISSCNLGNYIQTFYCSNVRYDQWASDPGQDLNWNLKIRKCKIFLTSACVVDNLSRQTTVSCLRSDDRDVFTCDQCDWPPATDHRSTPAHTSGHGSDPEYELVWEVLQLTKTLRRHR